VPLSDILYQLEDFHETHRYLSHEEARRIIAETGGNRPKADAAAESLRRRSATSSLPAGPVQRHADLAD
jgi:hypothetical protein